MEKSRNFKDLIVWQKSMSLITQIYRSTKNFPKDEMYGLTSQIRRSSVSVAANIAEGQGRNSNGEFVQFLGISEGSLAELETLLMVGENVGYITGEQNTSLLTSISEIKRLLLALKKSIKNPQL